MLSFKFRIVVFLSSLKPLMLEIRSLTFNEMAIFVFHQQNTRAVENFQMCNVDKRLQNRVTYTTSNNFVLLKKNKIELLTVRQYNHVNAVIV